MSDSNTLKTPSFAPIGYTALAVLLSLVARSLFMPKWTPVQEPVRELTFLILWIMALLPVLYLAFRRWAEESIESFFPQVFVFLALSFAIQTALNAVSMGFDLLQIPNSAVMPFVWALPWLALTTKFKMSYATRAQCKSLLLTILPIALVFHILYLMLPIFALAYIGVAAATATLFGLTALCYGLVAWRLRMSLLKRPLTRA